ncbi:ubiquitin carboxyl-terminal hydrolase L5 [Cryptococcus deuterogattii 99/473]|uniref:Ubiquitin carboxyl-terminal hydrolase n=2 Tax=Cryptococcus deuterogattii TaxID=1859096 RepID=A0A0D0VCU3_9TREE|nr:ubiquitin carboxyl-terminal hydrolase L5 [Cryptococcus deuterogattii R265]KIR29663.1 ubiquitin carboxyl-terminal hydrolase L5 [Cryptococcus deuterogattii LA55]KIR36405.1 ubiquitin carboxyl-terminal hydrolase L5 [Cryptococcus deuterogattii MMRL2647]KIR42640.1 ubiquitin carboxyl-terminal hydrolase L5 [Cryptococcus deuterogattii Ram5]KIR75836.1 ubiquitin carboxyl-terminal hydrolase L5 [Cryptococcus deuterogattii CA1014]KIR95778.1 ubiquitin carboxyl-terminal hydrolase L5 [Cryptococcus deuteroga
MADDPSGWSLTESDPQVFTQLLKDLGVKGLQVDDLYSLDAETLATLKPIHALIFLFKYVAPDAESSQESAGVEVDPLDNGVWFANQVINNSCGTLAALNAVMNITPQQSVHEDESIQLGSELENLREFGAGMQSLDLGHVLSSSDHIREVHNSFSKSSPFSMDPSAFPEREKEDAYHFVAYLPVNDILYELDGLRRSPIMHAPVEDDWLNTARETIEQRIATYPAGSLMFNLLCVRSAAIPRLERLLNDPSTPAEQKFVLQDQLEHERNKSQKGAMENSLRRHNLLPVVFQLFKSLGESGMAAKAVEDARAKGKERRERMQTKGEAK